MTDTPTSWDPRHEADQLEALARIATAMHHGRAIFDTRLDEIGGGYPSAGGGNHGNAANGGPTLAAVIANVDEGRADVAASERAEWDRNLRKALEHAAALWAQYQRLGQVRNAAPKLVDPGCELCAQVPCGDPKCRCAAIDGRHYCPTRYTVERVVVSKRKGVADKVEPIGVCSSCYEFQRADRAGRLPSHDEVLDHVEGRRRRYSVGQRRPA